MNYFKLILCALLQLAFIAEGNAQLRSLPSSFTSWTHSAGLEHATITLEIMRLPKSQTSTEKPKVLYSYDAQRYMIPASVLKLVSSATALRMLGADYIWPDSIALVDTAMVYPLQGMENYNPDWLLEDVAASYMPGLYDLQPDSGLVLRDVMKETLKESLNVEAETMLRMLTPSCRLDSALLTLQDYWKGRNVDTEGLWIYDGCGLSPSNRVTAHFLCQMLADMQFDQEYRDVLPTVGREGTVRNFLKGTRLAGKSWLKSGTLKNVVAYAGYCQGTDGRTYAICVMVNNHTCKHSKVREGIANLLLSLIP